MARMGRFILFQSVGLLRRVLVWSRRAAVYPPWKDRIRGYIERRDETEVQNEWCATHPIGMRDKQADWRIGFESFILIISYCAGMTYMEGLDWWLWIFIWDNFLQLITGTLIFSTAVAFYCYISSFFTSEILASNSGNILYDVSPLPFSQPPY